jgi:hypothetical protein
MQTAKNVENASAAPREYPLVGNGGQAKSTIKVRNAALVHFNIFLITINPSLLDFDDWTEASICVLKLWQMYGYYLVHHAEKSPGKVAKEGETKELISSGTAVNYLSAAKEAVAKKFPSNVIFSPGETWYTKLRFAVESEIVRRCISKLFIINSIINS